MGGSGARVAESLTYLVAAGLFDDVTTVHLLLADAHKSNRNLQDARLGAQEYGKLKQIFNRDNSYTGFRPNIRLYEWDIMFNSQQINNIGTLNISLKDLAKMDKYGDAISESEPTAQDAMALMEALFTAKERERSVAQGYHAHPAIGAAFGTAAVKAAQSNSGFGEFCNEVRQSLLKGDARLALVGSLFGGTGASSMSSLVRAFARCKDDAALGKLVIAGIFLLPYFAFNAPPDSVGKGDAIKRDMFNFGSRSALEYYNRCGLMKTPVNGDGYFDAIYMLGFDKPTPRAPYADSDEQENPSHFVEMEAGMAVRDFIARDVEGNMGSNAYIKGITEYEGDGGWFYKLTWDNLSDGATLRKMLGRLLRVGLLFSLYIYPNCFEKTGADKKSAFAPYHEYIDGMPDAKGHCDRLLKFFTQYMRWCGETANTLEDPSRSELFDLDVLNKAADISREDVGACRDMLTNQCDAIVRGENRTRLRNALNALLKPASPKPDADRKLAAMLEQEYQLVDNG
jgi:hypothetical protein